MKFCLVRKPRSGPFRIGNFGNKLGIEIKLTRQFDVTLQQLTIFFIAVGQSPVQIARDPFELAIDLLVSDKVVNLIDSSYASFPKGFGGFLAEDLDQMVKAFICHIRKM